MLPKNSRMSTSTIQLTLRRSTIVGQRIQRVMQTERPGLKPYEKP